MKSPNEGRTVIQLSFTVLRHISSPEDTRNGRKIYAGHLPVNEILDLPTDENVRGYLVEAEGKKRRTQTTVHRAIRETLTNHPDNFCVLNSGIVIVARDLEVDEKEKKIRLKKPSIINGAQTQGVLKGMHLDGVLPDVNVKFEIIVTEDEDVIADTSIARNYQNDVMTISIAGRLGQLDELEASLKKVYPDVDLRKSETEWPGDDYLDTEKLLQVITALIPPSLWIKTAEKDNPNKVYTYSAKSKCLKDFQTIYRKAKDANDPDHVANKNLYQFYIEIAPDAYALYNKWKTHQGFKGTALRALEREGGKIVDIPDGIVFPILASLSVFAEKSKKGWKIPIPNQFSDEELIKAVKSVYMDIANSNPQLMGKTKACYTSLLQITSIYHRLAV